MNSSSDNKRSRYGGDDETLKDGSSSPITFKKSKIAFDNCDEDNKDLLVIPSTQETQQDEPLSRPSTPQRSNSSETSVGSTSRIPASLHKTNSIDKYPKRKVIDKDCFFMSLAELAAQRSKDPSMQVGACLVDKDSKFVLGVGYNGAPNHIDDNDYPWSKVESSSSQEVKCKNAFVIHAEANALALSDRSRHAGSIMYCTHYPCVECAKSMLHMGVKRIIYQNDSKVFENVEAYEPSKRLLEYAAENNIMFHEKFSDRQNTKDLVVSVKVNVDTKKRNESLFD